MSWNRIARARTAAFLVAGGFHLAADPPPEVVAQDLCTTTQGTQIVNGLFDSLTPVLNAQWPAIAVGLGLDPYLDVWDGYINIGCKNGGTEICAAQLAGCDWFRMYVRVSKINGLATLQFADLTMTSLTATPGTKACPFSTPAYTNACSYQGNAAGTAALLPGAQIRVLADKIQLKVKCDWGFLGTEVEKIWPVSGSGSADCTAEKVSGSADMATCAGTCASGSPLAAVEGLKTSDLKIHNNDISCSVSPGYSPVSWLAEIFIPKMEQTLINLVTPPIESALNSVFKEVMPFPGICR